MSWLVIGATLLAGPAAVIEARCRATFTSPSFADFAQHDRWIIHRIGVRSPDSIRLCVVMHQRLCRLIMADVFLMTRKRPSLHMFWLWNDIISANRVWCDDVLLHAHQTLSYGDVKPLTIASTRWYYRHPLADDIMLKHEVFIDDLSRPR